MHTMNHFATAIHHHSSSTLKELRNRRIIPVWSLLCLIRVDVGLHFLKFILENLFFTFLCFFWVILFSLYKNTPYKYCTKLFIKIRLCKKHAFREVLNFSKKIIYEEKCETIKK